MALPHLEILMKIYLRINTDKEIWMYTLNEFGEYSDILELMAGIC